MAKSEPLLKPRLALARDVACAIPESFRLESGQCLAATRVQGRIHGLAGPLVVVAGGISSGRFAADAQDGAQGWWPQAVGPGLPVDTDRLRVLAFDILPGREQSEPVTITPHDQARLLALLLDSLGEPVVDAFVGSSYGGGIGLAFAERFADRVCRLVVISAAHRAHPSATAWRGVQRRLLQLGLDNGCETQAIELARELAMTTYRTADEFEQRFGEGDAPASAGGPYAVCDYLQSRGRGYGGITTAARWISLSDSLDRIRVEPEAISAALTLAGFTSDRLVPVEDIHELAARAPRLERLVQADSLFGHDAFLKEPAIVGDVLRTALSPLYRLTQEYAA